MNGNNKVLGSFFALGGAFFWGAGGSINKALLNTGATPWLLILIRSCAAFIIVGLILLIKDPKQFKVEKKDIPAMLIAGIFVFIYASGYFFALYFMNVSLAVVLLYVYPSIVAVLSVFLLKEKLYFRHFLALIMVILGMIVSTNLINEGFRETSPLGFLLMVICDTGAVCYCFHVKKISSKYNPLIINFYCFAVTIIGYFILLLILGFKPVSPLLAGVTLCSGIPYALGFIGLAAGIKFLRPSIASVLNSSEVFFATLIAMVFLGEAVSFHGLFGMFLILGAIVLLETIPLNANPANKSIEKRNRLHT